MDSAHQVGVGGGGAGQAGVDCDGAEPAGVKELPERGDATGESEDDEEQEAEPPVPLLEQPFIVDGKREWRPPRDHNYALDPQGAPVEEVVFQSHAALGEGRLRQSRGFGRARPVRGIDKDQRQALEGSRGRSQEPPRKGAVDQGEQ